MFPRQYLSLSLSLSLSLYISIYLLHNMDTIQLQIFLEINS